MRKKTLSFFLTCVFVFIIYSSGINVCAYKSDPHLWCKTENIKVNAGEVIDIKYTYYYEYEKERIKFTLYKDYVDKSLWSYSYDHNHDENDFNYSYSDYTYSINTTGLKPGKYTLYAKVYYYESGEWKESIYGVGSTAYFTVNGFDNDDPANPINIGTYHGEDYSNTKREVYSSVHYSEWARGKWFDSNGKLMKKSSITWHHDSVGWWYTNEKNNYFTDHWNKIDSVWYYFKPDGYMAQNEWFGGYWFGNNGAWTYTATLDWHRDSNGWYVQDTSGWYPRNQWQKIDGVWRYFNSSGYMVTNQYVDGYWIGLDGRYY